MSDIDKIKKKRKREKGGSFMYIALESFATKDYDIKRKQLLEDDFTSQDEINEFLNIGYIEVYVPDQKVDTTDATAEADNIVTGKTAYAKGEKLVGTFTGIVPTGTKEITENGTVDVSGFASAEVNVSGGSSEYNGKFVTTPINPNYTVYPNIMKFVKEAPAINLTGFTSCQSFFNSCYYLEKLELFDTSNCTTFERMFNACYSLKSIPQFNTSKLTNMKYFCTDCALLEDIPILDTHLITGINMTGAFSSCPKLTNESLNNILYMCIHSGVTVSNYKTLQFIGLSQSQANTCATLSNWDAFVAAGWSTGY